MADTSFTEQEVINMLIGNAQHSKQPQEALADYLGVSKDQTIQQMLTTQYGLLGSYTTKSVQEMLFNQANTLGLGLTGSYTGYSEQVLWNKMYNAGKSIDEILNNETLSSYIQSLSGLVAYYPMDETSGSLMINKAPSTIGTLNGALDGTNPPTVGVAGQVGNAYLYDGTNDKVSIADNSAIEGFTTGITLFCLFNAEEIGGVFRKLLKKTNVYDIGINNTGVLFAELVGIHNFGTITGGDIDDDVWRAVFVTYDGSTAKFYLNNVEKESQGGLSGNIATSTDQLDLGWNGTEFFKGMIQHFGIFNRALTTIEIARIVDLAGLA